VLPLLLDAGHAQAGLAPEAARRPESACPRGSGFGVMALIVAAERGSFRGRRSPKRIRKIVRFLRWPIAFTAYGPIFSRETESRSAFGKYDNGGGPRRKPRS